MTSRGDFVQPPRIAVWLVNLFTPPDESESILGDLSEEFSEIASKSGVAVAKRWYSRQTVKTIAHLVGTGFRVAPLSTSVAMVVGLLLLKFVSRLPDKVLSVVTDRYLAYWSSHFDAYMFWATDGLFIAHVIASVFVGCVMALLAKGREMVVTVTLGFVLGALGIAFSLEWLARTGDMWLLALECAESLAIVIGGVIVRMRRSAARTRPLRA